mmetsp:Transcript_11037/g.22005  ORF Transcript_11037/g.22005 Transcript_11037/m.22005 type:complete len:292 (-) Transcript_11037:36-911(-)
MHGQIGGFVWNGGWVVDILRWRKGFQREGVGRWLCSGSGETLVGLTRERGKNDGLGGELRRRGIRTQELPCISFADGPDRVRLVENLGHSEEWAWIVITSPESADVFLDGWREAGETRGLRVAAVGGATRDRLEQAGVSVAFIPSKATGATLASELPELVPGSLEARILYPCSARAGNDLVESLSTRGYRVTRLNTYDTVPAVWTEAEKSLSSFIQIATFASPSAVQGWLNEAGSLPPLAACIGETSARACMNYMDSEQIFYPEKPGLPGWIDATMQAIDKAESRRENSDA